MTLSRRLAAFATDTRFEDLPAAVVEQARVSLVDLLMVAQAGLRQPHIAPILAALAAEGSGLARVWFGAERLPAGSAAFFNALCAATLDYDSVIGSAHADVVVWPALLALAATRPVSGRDLIVAHAVGAEVMARLSAAATPPGRGWSPTPLYGGFGSAAASARLLGLDAGRAVQALGLALSQAAGTQQGHIEQTLSKNAQPALAARAGLFAAQLAAAGLTAPSAPIEGRFGLAAIYQPLDEAAVLGGLGTRWTILGTAFKKYPVCACSHPLTDTVIALCHQHDLRADDIAGVEVVITPTMDRLVGGTFAPQDNPLVTAQFSLRYALASAIHCRALGLAQLHTDRVLDPAIATLAGRMTIAVDDGRPGAYGPADLRLRLRDGRVLEARTGAFPGGPEQPLTAEERDAKYRDCAGADGADVLAALRDWSSRLHELDDVDAAWPL